MGFDGSLLGHLVRGYDSVLFSVLRLVSRYFFSVIGLEAFHRERASAQVVETYDILEYGCNLGYEDFRCSLLMTFQITTSNNWNDIMNAVK